MQPKFTAPPISAMGLQQTAWPGGAQMLAWRGWRLLGTARMLVTRPTSAMNEVLIFAVVGMVPKGSVISRLLKVIDCELRW